VKPGEILPAAVFGALVGGAIALLVWWGAR